MQMAFAMSLRFLDVAIRVRVAKMMLPQMMARVRSLRLDMIATDCVCQIRIQMAFVMSLR